MQKFTGRFCAGLTTTAAQVFVAGSPLVRDTRPMSSATLIPVSEYLNTSYRPDCDYIDGEVQERIDDYIAMGVGYIWVIDPRTRHAWVANTSGLLETLNGEFIVEGAPIRISLAEVFAEFDEMQS